jgi:hypothetical protein
MKEFNTDKNKTIVIIRTNNNAFVVNKEKFPAEEHCYKTFTEVVNDLAYVFGIREMNEKLKVISYSMD